jgi:hypothetical protein
MTIRHEDSPAEEIDLLLIEIAKLQEQLTLLRAENTMLKWRLHEQD